MSRNSRRMRPALKAARQALRTELALRRGATRVDVLRGFIKGVGASLLNEFPDQGPKIPEIEAALQCGDAAFLETFALKLAQLRNELRLANVDGQTIH